MKRLGENVFQFPLLKGSLFIDLVCWFWPFLSGIWAIGPLFGNQVVAYIVDILLLFLCVVYARIYYRNLKKYGLVLDKDKGCISVYKWTWSPRGPQQFYVYPLNEILGFDGDVNVQTETHLANKGTSSAHWQTTERKTYNIVLHGKFGSKRVSFEKKDDWNLFQTLVSSDE